MLLSGVIKYMLILIVTIYIMTPPLMSPSGLAMSRQFIYCRVSTSEQTTENQLSAIRQRGYDVPANRIVSETVSGEYLQRAVRNSVSWLISWKKGMNSLY